MKKQYTFLFCLASLCISSQTILNKINNASFNNFASSYNYTYWDTSWKTANVARSFSNQASSYAINVDYTNLNINSLLINTTTKTPSDAFADLKSTTFSNNNYSGNINYSILKNGNVAYSKSASPTNSSHKDSQMAEYGQWCNRRFVSTNFTNAPKIEPYFTGIEFATWHNRFKISFHVRPTENISNGQLRFAIDIPAPYSNKYSNGNIYAYADTNNAGFVIRGGTNVKTLKTTGNTIEVTSASQTLVAGTSYEISLLFYALKTNVSSSFNEPLEEEKQIAITTTQTAPNINANAAISYNENEGIHYLDIPRYGMGYQNCAQKDIIQNIHVSLQNNTVKEKRVRLCFRQIPNVNVVGFNSLIRNANGDPSGFPIQVSKNWHNNPVQLFSGSWIKEYTEFMVPAQTTLNFMYTRTGAKWGETYAASSHQLSVVGAGVPRGGWLEAALGSFGENITHSPDYEYGDTNACDVRPFLVTNESNGGTSKQCSWTGNVGGFDMWVYENASGNRKYQSQVKTRFNKYSPNLTETSISAITSDEKLKLDYTFYLNRSNDFTRVYYKIKVKALKNASFSRFDIFQLGGDRYNIHYTRDVVYGNDTGVLGQLSPNNSGSNNYTTNEIALTGNNPWLWAGDGLYYTGANSGIDIDTNNAMIIRDYKATINGVTNNTPYFRERSSSIGFSSSKGNNPTSYCLVTPPGTTNFTAGDTIELLVEVVILPKISNDYYGPNANFITALNTYGNAYELLYRESLGNRITASSPTNSINTSYPLTVETIGNTGMVTITGGKGYIPLVFSGVTNISNPKLWKANNDCWELVDQSNHGKDFWQANFIPEKGNFELIYNVNQDIENDARAIIKYYLGNTPPEPVQVPQSNHNDQGWSLNTSIIAETGDKVHLAPQVTENNVTTVGKEGTWAWEGPSGYTASTRPILIYPVTENEKGVYTASFTDAFGCVTTQEFEIDVTNKSLAVTNFKNNNTVKTYPNPTSNQVTIALKNLDIETFEIYNMLGQDLSKYISKNQPAPNQMTLFLNALPMGNYFVKINNSIYVRVVKK